MCACVFSLTGSRQADIVQQLVPKDPHVVPKWCKPPQTPPAQQAQKRVRQQQRQRRRRLQRQLFNATGEPVACPALPSAPSQSVVDVYAARLPQTPRSTLFAA